MKVLVINSGSSSIKYQLFAMEDNTFLAKGMVERIGINTNHAAAIELIFADLTNREHGVLGSIGEVDAIGHRVVHGGEIFNRPVLIDNKVKEDIRRLAKLAPLHNPANLLGIEACEKIIPGIRQVAVFDTAFHHTIPPQAYLYGIPFEYYEKHGIRKYGFHGTSHQYVAQRAAALMDRPLDDLRLISCHLGSGSSITAILDGCSIETSMGFTPLEGLVMGTRSGDLDPAIVTYLMEAEGLSPGQVQDILNNKSGVLGVSGLSSDFRDLEQAVVAGHQQAELAMDVFVHRIRKYIGAYAAELNGVDGIIFTGGLGENSPKVRAVVCDGLDYLQMWLDPAKNAFRGREMDVTATGSKGRILVVPTNEELMIASETARIIGQA
jgi:acetate kinase